MHDRVGPGEPPSSRHQRYPVRQFPESESLLQIVCVVMDLESS